MLFNLFLKTLDPLPDCNCLLSRVLAVNVSAGVELSSVVNEGEDAGSWIVTAALSIASVLRELAGETLLQHLLGESLGLLKEPGPDTAAEVQSGLGGDLEIVNSGQVQTVRLTRCF